MCVLPWGPEEGFSSPRTELMTVLSCSVGAETQTLVVCKQSDVLNCWAFSPTPTHILHIHIKVLGANFLWSVHLQIFLLLLRLSLVICCTKVYHFKVCTFFFWCPCQKTTPSPTSGASSADAFLLRCSVYASTTESGLHMVSDKDMTVFPAQFVEVTVPFLSSDPGTLVGKGFQPWLWGTWGEVTLR